MIVLVLVRVRVRARFTTGVRVGIHSCRATDFLSGVLIILCDFEGDFLCSCSPCSRCFFLMSYSAHRNMFVLVIFYVLYGILLALWYRFRSQWTVSCVLCSR